MIQRQSDCPEFSDSDSGEMLKIEGEIVVEITGKQNELPDEDLVVQAVSAVIYYIRTDLMVDTISVEKFSTLLETVLEGFGFIVETKVKNGRTKKMDNGKPEPITVDLQKVVDDIGSGYELFFFNRLQQTVSKCMELNPKFVYLYGLQDCVKKLTGVKRWNYRCQNLSEDIVSFVREQFQTNNKGLNCALLIR